jgi:hypothetical protein
MAKKENFQENSQENSLGTLVKQNNKLFHTLEIFFIIAMCVIFIAIYFMNSHLNHIDTNTENFMSSLKHLSNIASNTHNIMKNTEIKV